MTRVYISYRTEDMNVVRQIYLRAAAAYGARNVILHPESRIPLDTPLDAYILNLMDNCKAIFLVIGKSWTGVDEFGRFLLSSADVPVGVEVAAAFRSQRLLIPVLVNGVQALPSPDDLPEEFHGLYAMPPVILRPGHFNEDIARLVATPSLFSQLAFWLSLAWLKPAVKPRWNHEDE